MNMNQRVAPIEPPTTIGVDFGTASVRAAVVDTTTGEELGHGIVEYPHGVNGVVTDPSDPLLARQHPADYLPSAVSAIRSALDAAGASRSRAAVRGIGVAATGSTPIPVDAFGNPVASHPQFADDLDAMAWLWKDHTAHAAAERINDLGTARDLLGLVGGIYSSEWYWAKLARFLDRAAPEVVAATQGWVELSDYVPGAFVGRTTPATMSRNVCAAGHKALYDDRRGGLPTADFLDSVFPTMSRFRWTTSATGADTSIGRLTPAFAELLGLPDDVVVAAGAFDAHLGAVGAGVAPGVLVKNIGTSTCDCSVAADLDTRVRGLCGNVVGSILPGMVGLEAGQSAVGDIFSWYADNIADESIETLASAASAITPGASGLVALDWHNGNRTVLVDPMLSGAVIGLNLVTTRAELFLAFVEATAYGARRIVEQIVGAGVPIDTVVAAGGIAHKSPLLMQILADVLNRPIRVAASLQAAGLGAAIAAAVAAGVHPTIADAQAAMVAPAKVVHTPDAQRAAIYSRLYANFVELHDAFGGVEREIGAPRPDVAAAMKSMLALRQEITRGSGDAA